MASLFTTLPSLCSSFNHSPSLAITSPLIRPTFKDTSSSRFSLKFSKISPLSPVIRAQSAPTEDFPDAKFYKVEAIIRAWRVPKVSLALLRMGIRGVTVSDVKGFGSQGGMKERHAGSEFGEDMFVSKVKMEIVVCKDQVEAVIEKIIEEARTSQIGDGKIFVIPVADIIRVRTGERGEKAERMSGGRFDMSSSEA